MNNEKSCYRCWRRSNTWSFLSEGLADAGYRVVVADLNGENAQSGSRH